MITKNLKDTYYLTKAQYEAKKAAGTLVEGAIYNITDDVVNGTLVGIDSTPTNSSTNLVTSGAVYSAISNHHDSTKVDVVSGKGLSTNDYDTTAKTKVDSIDTLLNNKQDKLEVITDAEIMAL